MSNAPEPDAPPDGDAVAGRALTDRNTVADIGTLRARIARLEAGSAAGAAGERTPAAPSVLLGVAELDAVLGGGLRRGALHEVRSADADGPLAFGFALALAARLAANRPALIVTTVDGAGEWGRPYGPGLAAFGLDPGGLLFVETRRPREALWAAEEGLASRALSAVVAEIRGDPAVVDLTATRRLALRAARNGGTALLVRPGTADGLSAARTRWRVAPLALAGPDAAAFALPPAWALPPPAWAVDLERNAARPGGRFALTWRPDERLFASADAGDIRPALPRPAPAAPAGGATREGTLAQDTAVLRFRRTG
ncbi:ImuA family protein [Microbaculum sp. FT89]|uniref:ImuA family protein n=1 Tax=Microbaculum sp. FT89 TaxID=3447298 RepID=UPI003F539D2C